MRTTNDGGRIRTFKAEGGAIGANLIVVWGTGDEQVKLPSGANEGAICGVTLHAAAAAGDDIEVQMSGVAEVVVNAASPNITKGLPIAIVGSTGIGAYTALANARHYLGFANEAATADGVRISVEISKFSTPAS